MGKRAWQRGGKQEGNGQGDRARSLFRETEPREFKGKGQGDRARTLFREIEPIEYKRKGQGDIARHQET